MSARKKGETVSRPEGSRMRCESVHKLSRTSLSTSHQKWPSFSRLFLLLAFVPSHCSALGHSSWMKPCTANNKGGWMNQKDFFWGRQNWQAKRTGHHHKQRKSASIREPHSHPCCFSSLPAIWTVAFVGALWTFCGFELYEPLHEDCTIACAKLEAQKAGPVRRRSASSAPASLKKFSQLLQFFWFSQKLTLNSRGSRYLAVDPKQSTLGGWF